MSPYLVLLILEFLLARIGTLPHGIDSNITQLLANLLTKPSVFYYLPIVSCYLASIIFFLLLLLLMMLYLDRMCQGGLHAVPCMVAYLYTYALAEPRSTPGLLFLSQCPSGTILLTTYSMVWDWRVSRAGPMLFYCLSCSIPTIVFY